MQIIISSILTLGATLEKYLQGVIPDISPVIFREIPSKPLAGIPLKTIPDISSEISLEIPTGIAPAFPPGTLQEIIYAFI